jgi:hypothetical protein
MRSNVSTTGYCLSDHDRHELRLSGRFSTGSGHARRAGFGVNLVAAVGALLDPTLEDS